MCCRRCRTASRLCSERHEPFPNKVLGPRWELLAQDNEIPGREVIMWDGWRMMGAVPMAQAIHHADDHRSQVLSILGAHGLDVPDLDVWRYAESAGLLQEPQAASGD